MRTYQAMAIALGLAMTTSLAFAQTAAPEKTPPGTNAPSQFDSQSQQSQRNDENLTDRLKRSGGVIKPPEHTDRDIHLMPPATGDRMSVPPSSIPPNKNPDEKEGTPK